MKFSSGPPVRFLVAPVIGPPPTSIWDILDAHYVPIPPWRDVNTVVLGSYTSLTFPC